MDLVFYFGDFRLDTARRELTIEDRIVDMPTNAFDCLAYLVRHRYRAVGRDELISAVWGRVDICNNMLSQTLVKVRRVLIEGGIDAKSVRTVNRFGYRWLIATREERVRFPGSEADMASSEPQSGPGDGGATKEAPPAPAASRRPDSVHLVWLAGIVTLVAAALLATTWIVLAQRGDVRRLPTVAGLETRGDIAALTLVLPADVHADAESDWLRFGLVDLVATRLRDGGVVTLDTQSTYALAGTHPALTRARPDAELDAKDLSRHRVYIEARLADNVWRVRLTSVEDTRRFTADAEGRDVSAAARLAADQLLQALGRTPPSAGGVPANLEELLGRTRVAALTDHLEQAADLIEKAPAALRETPAVQARLAAIEAGRGLLKPARQRLEQMLLRLDADSPDPVRLQVLVTLAAVLVADGAPHEALPLLDAAEPLAVKNQAIEPLAQAYEVRATAEFALGADQAGLEHLAKARSSYQSVGNAIAVAGVDLRTGGAAVTRSRYTEAVVYLDRAANTFEAVGAFDKLAFARATHVMADLALLDAPAAVALSENYWPPEHHADNERTLYFLIRSRALALLHVGRLADADALLARISSQAQGDFNQRVRQTATLAAADVALARGDARRAGELAAPLAHAAGEQTVGTDVRSAAWHALIASQHRSGDLQAAHRETAAHVAWMHSACDTAPESAAGVGAACRDARFYAEFDSALIDAADGRTESALQREAALLAEARDLQLPERIVEVAAVYVPALIAAKRLDQASVVVGVVGPWADRDFEAARLQVLLYRAQGPRAALEDAVTRLRQIAGERSVQDLTSLPPQ